MSTQTYPLDWPAGWPRTDRNEIQRANFGRKNDSGFKQRLTVPQARSRINLELSRITKPGHTWRVPPESIVISTNMPVRNDGLPRAARRTPDDKGVAVYFELDGTPHCLPCDKWDSIADNMAAIAAHIGALRGMERWGVADIKKAFTGYQALPSPDDVTTSLWRDVLNVSADAGLEEVQRAYRKLRSKYHTDKGGDKDKFQAVNLAWEQAKTELTASE